MLENTRKLAPAKINLMLRILGRRADGYHELQTVFQFLDLADILEFEARRDGRIELAQGAPGVPPERDLVMRAALALQQAAGVSRGATIRLEKKLPQGGGLGGGSSDAASTLLALNRLWGLHWPLSRLAELGLGLGADVPVFVRGHAAWAEGVGERLTPLTDLPEPWYLLLHPGVEVNTGRIFQSPELTRNSKPIIIADFLAGQNRNDCRAEVCRQSPPVAEALAWLDQYAEARLTGTGACLFAMFSERGAAEQVRRQVPEPWQAWVARGLNRSPALDGDDLIL